MLERTPVPVLPGPLRRPAIVVLLAAALGLGLLAIRFTGVDGPGPLDRAVDPLVEARLAPYRAPLRRLVRLAGPSPVLLASAGLALVSLAARRPRLAAVALAAPPLTGLVATTLQAAIGRTLEGGDALPSGHTAGATAVITVVVLIALSLTRRSLRTAAALGAATVLAVAGTTGLALVANDLHYVTDTLAGLCTGVGVVLGTALAVDAAAGAWRRRRSRSVLR
ncbi:MAG TPA: phosphatase PAP2 family protein [Pseudonocardia sp.]|nr:phosphatase PAP2 family protein [Pseudonocardia sp.]